MVCNLTRGREKYRASQEMMADALRVTTDLRARALSLAGEDEVAYRDVIAAYAMPRATEAEKAARIVRVQAAMTKAMQVQLQTAELAARVIELSSQIVSAANKNALSDLAVGTLLARAALEGAALNVRTNLAAIRDESLTESASNQLRGYLGVALARADTVIRAADRQDERLP
jgi:formiminotetrahydrofolate cyclodeaminase